MYRYGVVTGDSHRSITLRGGKIGRRKIKRTVKKKRQRTTKTKTVGRRNRYR